MVSSLPQTSSAVNIQIIEPKNFPGVGSMPGQVTTPVAGQSSPFGTPQGAASPFGNSPFGTFPAFTPQQQLQQAFAEASRARQAAEQARVNYVNLAGNLNNQAYQQQQLPFSQGGFMPTPQVYSPYQQQPQQNFFPPAVFPPAVFPPVPMPNMWNQAQGIPPAPMPNMWDPAQQFPQPQPWPPNPPVNPLDQPGPEADPFAQTEPDPFTPPEPPAQPEPPPEPTLKDLPVASLNTMIDQPQTLQERVDAMEEVAVRGQGDPKTYDLLTREALADTSHLTGQAKDDANYVRQAALWTLGMLNKSQNQGLPTNQLIGLNEIEQIVRNKRENPDVKAAAVQALQVINRPNERAVKKILKRAAKDKNPDVKRLAKEALSGKTIPLPNDPGAMAMMA